MSPHRSVVSCILACWFGACIVHAQAAPGPHVEAVRFWSFGDVTRIAIETAGEYRLASDQIEKPLRVYFDLNGLKPPSSIQQGMQIIQVGDGRIRQIRVAEVVPGTTRVVLDLTSLVSVTSSQLVNPDRLIIEVHPKDAAAPINISHSLTGAQRVNLTSPALDIDRDLPAPKGGAVLKTASLVVDKPLIKPLPVPAPPPPAPDSSTTTIATASVPVVPRTTTKPTADTPVIPATTGESGDPSLVRVLGLKLGRVVIDAGHGGKDTGTIGPNGLLEKDLVLDVALRLGKLIHQQLGAEVIYTRSDDTFVRLGERTAMANRAKADLFISIHANSSSESSATGVETYYFNLHGDKRAVDVAMRENAASDSAISDLNDLLHKAVLQTKLEESREFAQKVQESLAANSIKMNSNARDRGVRKAPFVVLIGATMPSILAEIGFVSNPHDEKLLRRGDQREKIAEALFKGVAAYANTLSHSQIARAGSK